MPNRRLVSILLAAAMLLVSATALAAPSNAGYTGCTFQRGVTVCDPFTVSETETSMETDQRTYQHACAGQTKTDVYERTVTTIRTKTYQPSWSGRSAGDGTKVVVDLVDSSEQVIEGQWVKLRSLVTGNCGGGNNN